MCSDNGRQEVSLEYIQNEMESDIMEDNQNISVKMLFRD